MQRYGLMQWSVALAHQTFFVITFMWLYAAGSCTSGDYNSDQTICAVKVYFLIIAVEVSFKNNQIIPRELAVCCF